MGEREYRVVWKREGLARRVAIYQTREGAEDGLRRFFVCDMDSRHIVDELVTDERQDALPGMEA